MYVYVLKKNSSTTALSLKTINGPPTASSTETFPRVCQFFRQRDRTMHL